MPAGITPILLTLAQDSWHHTLVEWTQDFAIVTLVAGMCLCVCRLLRGPHLADRALAVDTLAVELIGLIIVLTMRFGSLTYFDGILVLSLLGFAGTVAMAQYIGRTNYDRRSQASRP